MSLGLFDLTGRRALVTGSSQGIGFALAQGLRAAGATVIVNGRDEAKLAAAAARIGDGCDVLAFDVTDHQASRDAVDGFEAANGPIDILVNNVEACSFAALWKSFRQTLSSGCCAPIFPASLMSARLRPGT